MKALTLYPYWAMRVMGGLKTVEFRTWKTNYRGDLIICSSAKKERGCISGHALCVVNVTDCVPFTKKHLNDAYFDTMPPQNGYAWTFNDIRIIEPVPVKGQQGLFNLDIPLNYVPDTYTGEKAFEWIRKFILPITFLPEQP